MFQKDYVTFIIKTWVLEVALFSLIENLVELIWKIEKTYSIWSFFEKFTSLFYHGNVWRYLSVNVYSFLQQIQASPYLFLALFAHFLQQIQASPSFFSKGDNKTVLERIFGMKVDIFPVVREHDSWDDLLSKSNHELVSFWLATFQLLLNKLKSNCGTMVNKVNNIVHNESMTIDYIEWLEFGWRQE